jgi:hypothetical protein
MSADPLTGSDFDIGPNYPPHGEAERMAAHERARRREREHADDLARMAEREPKPVETDPVLTSAAAHQAAHARRATAAFKPKRKRRASPVKVSYLPGFEPKA